MSLSKEHGPRALVAPHGSGATTSFIRFLRVIPRPWVSLFFSAGLAASVHGQEPAEPAPTQPLPSPLPILDPTPRVSPFDQATGSEETPKPPTDEATTEEPLSPLLSEALSREEQVRSKKWRVIPFGRVGVTADDNVFIQQTNPQKDVYFTLKPGIAIGWGSYEKEVKALGEFEHYFEVRDFELEREIRAFVFAKYSPTVTLFSRLHGEDAFNQDAMLSGRWEFPKLNLGARVRYQTLSGPDFDTNSRTNRQVLNSAITSAYDFSEKTALEFNISNATFVYQNGQSSQPGQAAQSQQNSSETILEDWINYQWLPKTNVSLGGRVGFLELQTSPSQTYEQLLGRVVYTATGKLGFSISGGTEFRQVKDAGGTNLYPVVSVGASYLPFQGTAIYASAYQQNSASVTTPDENINSTGISARLRQRFFQRFYLEIEGSYRHSQYVSSATGSAAGRTDNYIFAKTSVSFDITKYLSAQFAYEYIQDDSSQIGSSFVENLVTAQINLQF